MNIVPSLALNTRYQLKQIEHVFGRVNCKLDCVLYLWRIFERLCDVEEAVKPLGILTGVKDVIQFEKKSSWLDNDALVFPQLDDAFRMGVPSDHATFEKFMIALTKALKSFHDVGVVHMDGYPSNFLWCLASDGSVCIRFVDWDAATVLGESFPEGMSSRMESNDYKSFYWSHHRGRAEPKCDAWIVFILSLLLVDERVAMEDAAKNGKRTTRDERMEAASEVNEVFRRAITRLREASADLEDDFQKWFASSWQ